MAKPKGKFNTQKERFDKSKWWFNSNDDSKLLFVERSTAPAMSKGERLQDLVRVESSKSKPHLLKVMMLV